MKSETIRNLLWMILFGILSIAILAVAVIFTAWWHVITSAMMAVLSYALYIDDAYGTVSVRDYFCNRQKQ